MSEVFVPPFLPAGYRSWQHQIAQSYFKSYSETFNLKDLVYLDKRTGRDSGVQSASEIMANHHFYEVSDLPINTIENAFSDLESSWARSLRFTKKNDLLADRDFYQLMTLAFSFGARTEDAIDRMAKILQAADLGYPEGSYRESSLKLIPTLVKEAARWSSEQGDWTAGIWSLPEENRFYLTSDRPIIFGDISGMPMRASMALHYGPSSVVFPLTAEKLFVAYLGNRFPDEIVKNHNRIQLWLAKDYVMANRSQEDYAQFYWSSFIQDWRITQRKSDYFGLHWDAPYYIQNGEGNAVRVLVVRVAGEESEYYFSPDWKQTWISR